MPTAPDPMNPAEVHHPGSAGRAAMQWGQHTLISPRGRVLQPTSISPASPYQIPEEEVPRNGIRVQRLAVRSRWTDGSSHLWQLRRVQPGTGESSSALRFDQALPNP